MRRVGWIIWAASAVLLIAAIVNLVAGDAGSALGYLITAAVGGYAAVYYSRRKRTQLCPRCGKPVQIGKFNCESCGFDFRTAGPA